MAPQIVRSTVTRRNALIVGSAGLSSLMSLSGHGGAASAASRLETNRALVQRIFSEGFNAGNTTLFSEVIAPLPTRARTEVTDHHDFASMATLIRQRIPGVEAVIEALMAEGDLVAARVRWFAPGPPNGIHLLGETLHVVRVVDGQVVQQWHAGWDDLARVTR
jgi:predicted SnoaL-like aldol condensation-catalyzing enzyme